MSAGPPTWPTLELIASVGCAFVHGEVTAPTSRSVGALPATDRESFGYFDTLIDELSFATRIAKND